MAKKSARISGQINEFWDYARKVTGDEMRDRTPIAPVEVTSERIETLVGDIQQALDGVPVENKVTAKPTREKKAWLEQLEQAEADLDALGGRGSMSRTAADTIPDRIVHHALRVVLSGESIRKRKIKNESVFL